MKRGGKMKKEDSNLILKIIERAEGKGLLMFDRMFLLMDLECCMDLFDLKLEELLNADDFNFCHDITGIQNNLNRETKKMDNFFVPRFARQ